MSRSTDPGHFFQTETSLEETARKSEKAKNKNGNPITLPSKILAIEPDPRNDGQIYVAESGGTVRRVVLETGDKKHVYRGPAAPVTCLCVTSQLLIAGSWDKLIWSWDLESREVIKTYKGHSDFVKAVLYFVLKGNREFLVSGGADASIIVWDVKAGVKMHTLKGHARGIQTLALNPLEDAQPGDGVVVFSGGSEREIRQWKIDTEGALEIAGSDPILEHETSVYRIRFDGEEIWTASADNTAKRLVLENGVWKTDTTLVHPDFVRDVVVDSTGRWVITACRDEEVRVWDIATSKLYHTFSGHFEEVTSLTIVKQTLVSAGIDCTIRQWSISPKDLQQAVAAAERVKKGVVTEEENKHEKTALLTEEEERELAELMEDND